MQTPDGDTVQQRQAQRIRTAHAAGCLDDSAATCLLLLLDLDARAPLATRLRRREDTAYRPLQRTRATLLAVLVTAPTLPLAGVGLPRS